VNCPAVGGLPIVAAAGVEGHAEVYEVEMKFPVADASAMEQKLVGLAARFREPVQQTDRYFVHPCRDFGRTDEALRLRRVGDEVELTWKGPRIDSAAKTRQEILLPLPTGPRTVDEWTELLAALGFRVLAEVVKRRHAARVLWQGAEVDAALDHVDGVGNYLELEILARQGEIQVATACVDSLARELSCGDAERRSYLELQLEARLG
jgi:adenylate cyclase class 2